MAVASQDSFDCPGHNGFSETVRRIDQRQRDSASDLPRVTALVSAYKSARFLGGCLEDLEAQTIASQLEIIVVDSASPENEKEIVAQFQQRHSNIVYLRTDKTETLGAAWNRAIKLARAPYVTNANTDDRHAVDGLQKLADLLDKNPAAGVAYASMAITEEENSSLATARLKGCFRARKFDRRRLFHDCLPGPQPMWRRALHERFGFFDESLVSAADYEFWLRISGETVFLHSPEVLGLFLDSPNSLSHRAEVAEREAELARARHWPREWGTRSRKQRSFLDRLTRRSTYEKLARDWMRRISRRQSA